MEVAKPLITIIGCGPGAPEYVTPAAASAVGQADVLLGAQRLLDLFPDSTAERIAIGLMNETLDKLAARVDQQKVAVLVSGDPGFHSLARLVVRRFGRDRCRVIPGISSIQSAFAALGLDWTDARFLSAHKEDPHCDPAVWDAEKIAVLGGRESVPAWIARSLVQVGAQDRRLYICENLTLQNERLREVALDELEGLALDARSIILILKRSCLT